MSSHRADGQTRPELFEDLLVAQSIVHVDADELVAELVHLRDARVQSVEVRALRRC